MRSIYVFLSGLLIGVTATIGVTMVVQMDESSQVAIGAITGEASDADNINHDNDLSFTNWYRGGGDKNKYPEKTTEDISILVNQEVDLKKLWSNIFSGTLAPLKPTIDFKAQTLLVVMSELKETDGYQGTIQRIERNDDKLAIVFDEKSPGNGCFTNKSPTRPVHVVSVEKQDEPTSISIIRTASTSAPCTIPLN